MNDLDYRDDCFTLAGLIFGECYSINEVIRDGVKVLRLSKYTFKNGYIIKDELLYQCLTWERLHAHLRYAYH